VWPDFVYGRREYVLDDGVEDEVRGEKLPVGPSSYQELNQYGMSRLASSPLLNFIDTSDSLISRGAYWLLARETGCMWNPHYRRFGDWEMFTRAVFYGGWRGKAVDHIVQRYHWTGTNLQIVRPPNETPVKTRG